MASARALRFSERTMSRRPSPCATAMLRAWENHDAPRLEQIGVDGTLPLVL
jgi:hypothetical protein